MQIVYSIVLAALLVVGYELKDNLPTTLLSEPVSKPAVGPSASTHALDFSSLMTKVVSLKTTDQGTPQVKLRAQMLREKYDGKIELKSPDIIMYTTHNTPPWHIHANWGYTDAHTHILRLENQVKLTHLNDTRRTFETTELFIFMKRGYATTNKPVILTEAGSQLRATGLRADLKHDNIKLLSHVDGEAQTQHHHLKK